MVRYVIAALAAILCSFILLDAQDVRYVDASVLTVLGRACPGDSKFARVDSTFSFSESVLSRYAGFSTGLAVLFRTDSRNISAKWKTSGTYPGDNMNAILQKGLDLYIRSGQEWVFAGVGRPSVKKPPFDTHEGKIVSCMDGGTKDCLLYLPLFDRVDSLMIGIDSTASIQPMESPFVRKVVFFGSSITHGASASRPGMAFPARFGRDNGIDVCNLGFSGSCKLQEDLARLLAVTDADVFVLDAFSNPSSDEIYARFDSFMDIVRKAHPHTPLVFLQTERRETRNFMTDYEAKEAAKQRAAEEVVRKRMESDPYVYFVDSADFLGHDHIATVDGVHPTDVGFTRMLSVISPVIRSILYDDFQDADNCLCRIEADIL